MKGFLLLAFLFVSVGRLFAQQDTILVYLDKEERPCAEAHASRYAIQCKEGNHWKKVVFDISDDKPIYGAYYSDSACEIFDGPYTAFNKNEKPVIIGRYDKNKKVGVWKGFSNEGRLIDSAFYRDGFIYGVSLTWYPDGTIMDSLVFEDNGNGKGRGFWPDGKPRESGDFETGKKNGQWTYYYKSGVKCQEVMYQADSALKFTCFKEDGSIQTQNCYYEKEAVFKGGDKAWMNYLKNKLRTAILPSKYAEGRVYGMVIIQFVVGIDGKVGDVKVVNSIDPDLDNIALDIIWGSPKWEPAVQFNRKVRAYRKQPITFSKVE